MESLWADVSLDDTLLLESNLGVTELAESPQKRDTHHSIEQDSSEMLLPEKDSSEMLLPEDDNSEMLLLEKDSSEMLLLEKDSSEMLLLEKDSETLLLEKYSSEMLLPEDDNSEMLLIDFHSQDLFTNFNVEGTPQLMSAKVDVLQSTNLSLQKNISDLEEELRLTKEDNTNLKTLNHLHFENALVKANEETNNDMQDKNVVSCGIDTANPDNSLPGSLLAMLNNLTFEESTYCAGDETEGVDLTLLDVTLTTELNKDNSSIFGKTLLTHHLGDIQSEAMKLKERTEELCRQNDELSVVIKRINKELDVEKEKLKGKTKDLKDEKEKVKKKDAQIKANNAATAKKLEEQKVKLLEEKKEELKRKDAQQKSNNGLHKKALEEVRKENEEVKKENEEMKKEKEEIKKENEEMKKENEEMRKEKEFTEEQAKGLAKIINTKKETVNKDCQTTDSSENICKESEKKYEAVCEDLIRAQKEKSQLTDRLGEVEDHYSSQIIEQTQLLQISQKEKIKLENELYLVKQIIGSVNNRKYSSFSFKDEGVEMSEEFRRTSSTTEGMSNDTLQFSQLTNDSLDGSQSEELPEVTHRLVGMFKTATEQVIDLQHQLLTKSSAHAETVRINHAMQLELGRQEAQIKKLTIKMDEEKDTRDKLLEANKVIAKLKGEILRLSTEVQQGQHGGDSEELVEENIDLKQQLENMNEVRARLMSDVQMLREQLIEEQQASVYNNQLLVDSRNECNELRNGQESTLEKLKASTKHNRELEAQIEDLQDQMKSITAQLRKEKENTDDLLKQTSSNDRVAKANLAIEELDNEVDRLKRLVKKKDAEIEDAQDEINALKSKLKKIQPSLLSLEEDNMKLKQQLRSLDQQVIQLKEDNSILEQSNNGLAASVSDSLKSRLEEARKGSSEHEARADALERDSLKLTSELHKTKEDLSDAEEKIEKLNSKLSELHEYLNRSMVTNSSQTKNRTTDASSFCDTISDELNSYRDQVKTLESDIKRISDRNAEIERELTWTKESVKEAGSCQNSMMEQFQQQRSEHNEMMLKMQQEQQLALTNLRNSLTAENDSALAALRDKLNKEHESETEALKKRLSEEYSGALERAKSSIIGEHGAMMDKVVSDMETKRQQDYTLISRKAGLDPATLTKVLPNSTQLDDRIEALHKQALQIRNLALQFYDASHKPTSDICIQTSVKVFRCSTQTIESSFNKREQETIVKEIKTDEDVLKVLREEHAKQTETLLSELRVKDDPLNKTQLKTAQEEIQHLKLSVETYTTRCAILEYNNRILKDRNSGLENDLMINAGESYLESESVHEEYSAYTPLHDFTTAPNYQNRHAGRHQQNEGLSSHYEHSRPNNDSYDREVRRQNKALRNRLADCQNEITNLQSCVADYQENVERIENELDGERVLRDKAEKIMRNTEAALIEVKNDAIFDNDQQVNIMRTDLGNAKENIKILEKENKKIKEANSKLKDLNFSLLEANQKLKSLDSENIYTNISNKSHSLLNEIDSIKLVEDLRLELNTKTSELQCQTSKISANLSEFDMLNKQIKLLKDEMESKDKVIKMIKSELSTQQLDCAETRALLDIEKCKSQELERQFKIPVSQSKRYEKSEIQSLKDLIFKLKSEKFAAQSPHQDQTPKVTRAYLKYLRAESSRKALVFQKQYLMGLLANAKAVENVALSILEIKSPSVKTKKTFKHAAILVLGFVRMRNLVAKWGKIRNNLEEKQRMKQSPSYVTPRTTQNQFRDRTLHSTEHSREHSHESTKFNTSYHSNNTSYLDPPPKSPSYPKWDSSRPLTPPKHISPPHPPEVSLSRLDLQLARLRRSVQLSRASDSFSISRQDSPTFLQSSRLRTGGSLRDNLGDYVDDRYSNIPEKDETDNGDGTLCDISNYISRLEAVQSRLTDLKLSSYKIYDTNT